ncbi:MAG: hypothetical protein Q9228_007561 [Teloschistes exilis]
MDHESAVLIGLPLVLGLIFCGLWMNPYFVLDVELQSKCVNVLGYIAVASIWMILLWEWVINPAIKCYRLFVEIYDLVVEMISRFFWLYLYPLIRKKPRRSSQSGHQEDFQALTGREIPSFQAAAHLAKRAVSDQNSDEGSSTTYKDSTDGDNRDQLCPFNDSGVFIDSESTHNNTDGTEKLAPSEEPAPPPAQCQALIKYPRLSIKTPFLKETPPQPADSPSRPPPTKFRDSITLRKEQLADDAATGARQISVVRRRPRVHQFKDPPSPPKTPTLNQYTISPGQYSKDLEEEFGDLFLGQVSPRSSQYSRKSSMTDDRSVSSPRRLPSSALSSPVITEEPCGLVDDGEDDSLIVID